jgi:hypothetical protein
LKVVATEEISWCRPCVQGYIKDITNESVYLRIDNTKVDVVSEAWEADKVHFQNCYTRIR